MLGKLKASLLDAYCLNIGGAEAGHIVGAARFLGVDGCLPCLVLRPAAPTRDFLPPDAGCSSMQMGPRSVSPAPWCSHGSWLSPPALPVNFLPLWGKWLWFDGCRSHRCGDGAWLAA